MQNTPPLTTPIAILGGTFDPVHQGHIHVASAVHTLLPNALIKLLPCYQPVHRQMPEASVEQRIMMLKLTIETYPFCEIDYREISRKEPSYMIDTLKSIRNDYPNSPLCLILGNDAYQQLPSWKDWKHLLNYCHLIVINRPNTPLKTHPDALLLEREDTHPQSLSMNLNGNIYFLTTNPYDISATEIRKRIASQLDITSMVPINVAKYIYAEHLYEQDLQLRIPRINRDDGKDN